MINFLAGLIVGGLVIAGSAIGYMFVIMGTAAAKILHLEKEAKKGDN